MEDIREKLRRYIGAIAVGGNHLRKPGWMVFVPSKQEVNTIWFKIVKGLKYLHLSEFRRISEKN